MKRIAILYTELAEYLLACISALQHKNCQVLVVHWPINPEAPFQFNFPEGSRFIEKQNHSAEELTSILQEFDPELLVCCGWIDSEYLAAVKKFSHKIPTVLTMDNHWKGTIRQRLGAIYLKPKLKKLFSHIWIPGQAQMQMAKKIGFTSQNILTGFYSADVDLYNAIYQQRKQLKPQKKLLYVGRYVEHKGIFDLWEAFNTISETIKEGWELHCLGTGEKWENRIKSSGIVHHGFVQPSEMKEHILSSSVFILPSHFEPWGVVVHELAVAGLPLIVSDQVGAANAYLRNGENGFIFQASNRMALKKHMEYFMTTSEENLLKMGEKSHNLGIKHSPEKWANTLLKLL